MTERYGVKEVFDTLQGEGSRAGARSVFVRFSGCNLWTGSPLHRDAGKGACAAWCDTDFFKGVPLDLIALLAMMDNAWPTTAGAERWCVLSGGEPMLQVNAALTDALHAEGWKIAVETNGTVDSKVWDRLDHVACSPKGNTALVVPASRVDELKVVLPGSGLNFDGWKDDDLDAMAEHYARAALFVQPQDVLPDPSIVGTSLLKDGVEDEETNQLANMAFQQNLNGAIAFIRRRPRWRLSLQTHKLIGLP
jgi:organic radical activating enzyme